MENLPIQIHIDDDWIDAGTVYLRGQADQGLAASTRFEYDLDFATANLDEKHGRAVSLGLPVTFVDTYYDHWPPFLLDLFPEGAALKYINRIYGIPIAENYWWDILRKVIISPPGNVRIKPPNEEMEKIERASRNGFSRQDILDRRKDFLEHLVANGAAIGGATNAQGGAPKFLLREDHNGLFHADLAISDAETAKCWLVKFPRGSKRADKMILQHEAKYYRIAAKLGLNVAVPPIWEADCLFFLRFDREKSGKLLYHGLESLNSARGISGFGVQSFHEDIIQAIGKLSVVPQADISEYLKREILNTCMGNTDNHGRNTAFIKTARTSQISPLFDFAPMQFDPDLVIPSTTWRQEAFALLRCEGAPWRKSLTDFISNLSDLEELMVAEEVDKRIIAKTRNQRTTLIQQLQK